MIIENFSKKVINSNVISTYVAAAFFGTLIFFVLNANFYTPLEMLIGIILATIAFKGISNMMLSLLILLFNLNNKEESVEFDKTASSINSLLNDLALQQAKIKTNQSAIKE